MASTDSDHLLTQCRLPLLPLRDVVVYPYMVIPLFVGRKKSIQALEQAMNNDKRVLLLAQQNAKVDSPEKSDLFKIGTAATVLQMLKLPDGTVKVLVEGEVRVAVRSWDEQEDMTFAMVESIEDVDKGKYETDAMIRSLVSQFETYVQSSKKVPPEVLSSLSGVKSLGKLVDTIAAHMPMRIEDKQKVLEIFQLNERVEYIVSIMQGEMDFLQVEKKIRGRVKKQMERSQREYYLNEQMKAIQKELGDMDESPSEMDDLKQKIESAGMPSEAKEKVLVEFNKLKMMSPMSAEATVVRGYIDWMINVPWKKRSKLRHDMQRARDILEADHYGLEEVKERIIEYLAVQKRVKKIKGPVLCLVGPPGVGKTSLGESLARATNRQFIRMALGGVRDEAEIRGHRRTYIGSMPGKLIQKMAKAEVKNPLFLLDEIDKMGTDMRGDPASALLEVLDPEQNRSFNDHYLEVDYDLSDVMFVCTSNSMNIPAPLLDRMEVIRIPGYTEDEKVNIARRYLVPKQQKNNGLKSGELAFKDEAVLDMIRYYTKESGVRGLEREIAKICRRSVKDDAFAVKNRLCDVTPDALESFLGVRKYSYGCAEKKSQVGRVTGLAWTQMGGELLTIEAAAVKGKGQIIKTGSLGDVMQESIQTALTVVRSRVEALGISADFHQDCDVHIHVPEGATPKDGPSAGIAMCTALVSVLTRIPVKASVAMTGEITLRGQVLAIGGLKEKLLAAHRGGIHTVLIPEENRRDLKEIPDNIKNELTILPVKWIDQVLETALEYNQVVPEEKDKSLSGIEKSDKVEQSYVKTH
ncbi:Lon protease [invertebrate metagenome]|uniref:endopeptidase La n=1 Tax=invertebrate metagenome TaxID=1711999 RepID=A0A2H9T7T0_9ZZZZ